MSLFRWNVSCFSSEISMGVCFELQAENVKKGVYFSKVFQWVSSSDFRGGLKRLQVSYLKYFSVVREVNLALTSWSVSDYL